MDYDNVENCVPLKYDNANGRYFKYDNANANGRYLKYANANIYERQNLNDKYESKNMTETNMTETTTNSHHQQQLDRKEKHL